MKKYLLILVALCTLTSCYDDYVKNNDTQGVGFANQTDVRSVIVGEGMQFSTGVALGGVIENTKNRPVSYEIDYSLVNDQTLQAMKSHVFAYIQNLTKPISQLEALPANEYKLRPNGNVDGRVVIEPGTHLGKITIRIDSLLFLADASRTTPKYVIPLRLTDGHGTSLIKDRTTSVIGVRYENMLFGNYWHGGETIVKDALGTEIDRIAYYTTIPQPDTRGWALTTVAPFELTANAVGGELNGSAAELKLIQGENGQITVAAVAGAKYVVEPDGDCSFNRAKLLQNRRIYLKYKYEKDGYTYHATDTLTFRNRIRDGVNEWQDENPGNYQ
ncbi:DUF1735 domain-containing protein [uncultured Alistipes sp.]|jgi:hypothetical protein bacD2_25106|uniref:DUF1735 domain-containing protein n=1 Tax=uncultured Alistipes sp. TaxID=538949 RepID=UPI0025FAEEDB|nr:DUF1735 domain-containing protein [uncultured Alistipes sp.]